MLPIKHIAIILIIIILIINFTNACISQNNGYREKFPKYNHRIRKSPYQNVDLVKGEKLKINGNIGYI